MANTFTAATGVSPLTVMGNVRCAIGTLTMTDGNGGVDVGLGTCWGGSVTPKTAVTGGFGIVFQTSSGNVHVYSAASGDTFNLCVYGT